MLGGLLIGIQLAGTADQVWGGAWTAHHVLTLSWTLLALILLVLSWADYSYVLPASAAGYAIVPLLGYVFGGEQISLLRWGGVLMICLGVIMVGRTPLRTGRTHGSAPVRPKTCGIGADPCVGPRWPD